MIRKAQLGDVPDIHALINEYAEQAQMLFRAPAELYEHLRDFYVCQEDARVVGCCALEIMWRDLAEIKSLSVEAASQSKGIGRQLVEAAVDEARQLGLRRVFALTRSQGFFERLGFSVVDRNALPHKVWDDCLRCTRRDNCDETAVVLDLSGT
ncbi:MAG: N-acetyltransferase [Phycisphaerae bacterium]|nr:N-acetyltransferase [Phycisphaerae bacterium]